MKDALADLKLTDKAKLLRIGFTNPLPDELIKNFLQGLEKVLVVEEGEPYLEEGVKACAQEAGLPTRSRERTRLFSRGSSSSIRPWFERT